MKNIYRWDWKEKYLGDRCVMYISKSGHFGFGVELTTSVFSIFIGWFGIEYWFK